MARSAVWRKILQAEKLKRSSVCVSAIGPDVYFFGGELKPREPRDNDIHRIELFNAKHGASLHTIQAPKNGPTPRVGAATTVLNEKMYMFSGRGGLAMTPIDEKGALWIFDSSSQNWSVLSPSSSEFPSPRSYHCMTNNGKDTIYVHAGCPEKGRLSDLWAFSTQESQWKQLASAPDPPMGGTSIAFADGKIYRMNGFDGKTEQGGNLDIFNPSTNSWSSVPYNADGKEGPGARSVAALVPLNVDGDTKLVTLFGESDPSSLGHQGAGKMLTDGWMYSVSNGKWSQLDFDKSQETPQGRGWFDADRVSVGGKDGLVLMGGLGESNDRLDDAWMLSLQA